MSANCLGYLACCSAKLTIEADRLGVDINTVCLDINAASFDQQHFDLIIVNHYLDRNLAPPLVRALNPGGILFYQTFVRTSLPSNNERALEILPIC